MLVAHSNVNSSLLSSSTFPGRQYFKMASFGGSLQTSCTLATLALISRTTSSSCTFVAGPARTDAKPLIQDEVLETTGRKLIQQQPFRLPLSHRLQRHHPHGKSAHPKEALRLLSFTDLRPTGALSVPALPILVFLTSILPRLYLGATESPHANEHFRSDHVSHLSPPEPICAHASLTVYRRSIYHSA